MKGRHMTTSWILLDQSHHGVEDTEWTLPTPCVRWNVTQVLHHAAGDHLGYAAAITGSGGPTENPFTPSGERPEQPQAYLEAALASSTAALVTVVPGTPQVNRVRCASTRSPAPNSRASPTR